jgi:hypothetical protein
MKSKNMLVAAMCMMVLVLLLTSGCAAGEVKKEQPGLLGLVKLDTDDELNIVNWTVDGTQNDPKLGSVNWELKQDDSTLVWSGIAAEINGIPDAAGVYYIDVNKNDRIDIGDTFRVKAPEDGNFTLYWNIGGNVGQYDSHY